MPRAIPNECRTDTEAQKPAARAVRIRRPAAHPCRLSAAGLDAEVVAWQWIPFGPVLTSRAWWLEETDRLDPGRREEELLVIRADKP